MKLESFGIIRPLASVLALVVALATVAPGRAALEITEIMYDPLAGNDLIYEWIEVRNTGAVAIDLNGAWMDDMDPNTQAIPLTGSPTVGANASTTIVPAGGVAVIYDAFHSNGSPANFNDTFFRNSWGLGPEVPLIAGDFFPNLNNTSPSSGYMDNIAIWQDPDLNTAINENYELDVDRGPTNPPPPENDDDDRVVSLNNTIAKIIYQSGGPWPGAAQGVSVQWRGVGDINDGANWYASVSGQNGATTNTAISYPGATNSPNDIANPGFVMSGTQPAGLRITEILYNPASPENTPPGANWEWIEVRNNTGATIDFSSTPYVLDDLNGNNLAAANVTTGTIADDSIAVLFNANAVSVADMQAAWGNFINFIPVTMTDFSLNNGAPAGDTIGLWSSHDSYTSETDTDPGAGVIRTFANALVSVDYDNNANNWPDDDGRASIHLADLGADPALGVNWALSTLVDGISYGPNVLSGTITIHPGGDVGSPGTFVVVPEEDADYNRDGTIDAADYVAWRKVPGSFGGDPDGYNDWREQFGETASGSGGGGQVPEPAGVVMLAIGLSALCFRRRSA